MHRRTDLSHRVTHAPPLTACIGVLALLVLATSASWLRPQLEEIHIHPELAGVRGFDNVVSPSPGNYQNISSGEEHSVVTRMDPARGSSMLNRLFPSLQRLASKSRGTSNARSALGEPWDD